MRNSKNKKLLCLLLTAAMLVQPLVVSASAEEPVAEQADLQDDEMSADLMEMPPADQTEPVDTESEEPVTDLAGQTDAEAADLDASESEETVEDQTDTEETAVPEDAESEEPAADQNGQTDAEEAAEPEDAEPEEPAADQNGQTDAEEAADPDDTEPEEAAEDPTDSEAVLDGTEAPEPAESEESEPKEAEETPVLHNGEAVIPAGSDASMVKLLLAEALLDSPEDFTEEELLALDWQYYCEGRTKIGTWGNRSWGSIEGFTTETGKLIRTQYTHPALADNQDEEYQVRLAGTDAEVTLSKKAVLDSGILLREGTSVSLPWTEEGTVDYGQLKTDIFQAAVAETTPELTPEDMDITYYATAKTGSVGDMGKNWAPLGGGKVSGLEYPAISAGEHPVRFSWSGDGTYAAFQAETTITVNDRAEAPYVRREPVDNVKRTVKEDLSVDYDLLKEAVFDAVIAESEVLTKENVSIEYYATAKSGSVGSLGKGWAPLDGGKVSGLEYPGIPAGVQTVRISWPGSSLYAPTTVQADVEVLDREQVQFELQEGPFEVGMVFTEEQGYDYDATAGAIYDAVIASVSPEVPYETVKVEYNTDLTGLTHISYRPLNEKDATGLVGFRDGTWEIRISCGDTVEYRGNSVTMDVTVLDNRIVSSVAVRDGASFTYHMDPAVMEQAIFAQAIDWENSELPARETLDLTDFEILYKAQIDVLDSRFDAGKLSGLLDKIPGLEGIGGSVEEIAGSLNDSTKRWMPVEGGEYLGIPYAPMGAGQHQIQIVYKGNADYRPSQAAEGTVTVNKANVKVSVHSDNIYADQTLPEGFITTDPADQFDFYTIYTGATSNVNLGLYLDLPDKFDNNRFIRILDPVVEKITGRSFSRMMQDGITVGELRKLFDSTELLELLDKIGVDTGAFGQILKVVNAMPSVLDGTRIGFGAPNRAGLYSVTVITDNKNYNTGVGVGALLVRMRSTGVKLNWNEELGSKISAADARNFDFCVTLSCNGDVTVSQDNVHYLYSGFTSKWKVYSSTTTPPTEPGRYVMTVVTLGGNYQALPVTRSFQITK